MEMIPAKIRRHFYHKRNIPLICLEISLAFCVLAGAVFVATASLEAINTPSPSLTNKQASIIDTKKA